jgi:cytoskeletal protein CcmA (bactofilin family)
VTDKKEAPVATTTTTAIGPSIVIKGKLKSDEDLIVKGRIEAELSSSKALFIENSGVVKANVRVKSARVSGVLVGNINAEDKIELAPDGRMVGDMSAPRIIISDGAAFRGRIDMTGLDEGGRETKAEPPTAPAAKGTTAPAAGDGPTPPQAKQQI